MVGLAGGGVGNADGEFHFGGVVPAADFAGAALGFEVEVDDVFTHAESFAQRRGDGKIF